MDKPSQELINLVRVIADWAERWGVFEKVYVFGSRVRGDHRPDSDLDIVWVFGGPYPEGAVQRWNDDTAVDDLETRTGLKVHFPRDDDEIERRVMAAARAPYFVVGKVVCVSMPRR